MTTNDNSTPHETAIDPRLIIAALWTSILFIFAYVDLFAFFRADFRAEIEGGTVAGFTLGQTFLFLGTIYIMIPSLMVFLSLVLPRHVNKWANIGLPILYSLTILAGMLGEEWIYYQLGSVVEVILLLVIVRYAWRMG